MNTIFEEGHLTLSSQNTLENFIKSLLATCGFTENNNHFYENNYFTNVYIKIEGDGISLYINNTDTRVLDCRATSNNYFIKRTETGEEGHEVVTVKTYYSYIEDRYIFFTDGTHGIQFGIVKLNNSLYVIVDEINKIGSLNTHYDMCHLYDIYGESILIPGFFFDQSAIENAIGMNMSYYQDGSGFAYLIPADIMYRQYTENTKTHIFDTKYGRKINQNIYFGYFIGNKGNNNIIEFVLDGDHYICLDSTEDPIHFGLTIKLE